MEKHYSAKILVGYCFIESKLRKCYCKHFLRDKEKQKVWDQNYWKNHHKVNEVYKVWLELVNTFVDENKKKVFHIQDICNWERLNEDEECNDEDYRALLISLNLDSDNSSADMWGYDATGTIYESVITFKKLHEKIKRAKRTIKMFIK